MDLAEENKLGCIAAIILAVVIVFGIGAVVLETMFADGVRGRCLECSYPNYVTHGRNGYCFRVGSMVVPVEEACQK